MSNNVQISGWFVAGLGSNTIVDFKSLGFYWLYLEMKEGIHNQQQEY